MNSQGLHRLKYTICMLKLTSNLNLGKIFENKKMWWIRFITGCERYLELPRALLPDLHQDFALDPCNWSPQKYLDKSLDKVCNEKGHPFLNLKGSQWKLRDQCHNFQRVKATVEQILGLEELNQFKETWLWVSEAGVLIGKITIWERLFEIQKL